MVETHSVKQFFVNIRSVMPFIATVTKRMHINYENIFTFKKMEIVIMFNWQLQPKYQC
jgi:hypothetical protein